MEINYLLNNFLKYNYLENVISQYILNNEIIIFHKLYEELILSVLVENESILIKYLDKLNEYINWLGKRCKKYIINCYDNIIENTNGYGGLEWYTTFECISIIIILDEKGNIFASIDGNDFPGDVWMHNEIIFKEKDLVKIGKKY